MTDNRLHNANFCRYKEGQPLNNPSGYVPDRNCIEAARMVRQYVSETPELHKSASQGKMFGVLVVEDKNGDMGYLAGFSGLLAGKADIDYFVPPLVDLTLKDSFFSKAELRLKEFTEKISQMEKQLQAAEAGYMEERQSYKQKLSEEESLYRKRKEERHLILDDTGCTPALRADTILESQRDKAMFRRKKKELSAASEALLKETERLKTAIESARQDRKSYSRSVQEEIFSKYRIHSQNGDSTDIPAIFKGTPPSGTGDCAAPKLLDYAFRMGYRPLGIAEFWYGKSPEGLIRHDGNFYPACTGKCGPLLDFMLKDTALMPAVTGCGIDISGTRPDVLFEDKWIMIVDKPAGMLSTPGKNGTLSVEEITGYTPAHRLDMDTSGILVLAKDAATLSAIRLCFEQRQIDKEYIAILEGCPERSAGVISLPLSADYLNRPLQAVDFKDGKEAITEFRTTGCDTSGNARIILHPETGRTHQLRVHCAHHLGLGHSIKGDPLYGTRGARLCLHSSRISFIHPYTGDRITVTSEAPF